MSDNKKIINTTKQRNLIAAIHFFPVYGFGLPDPIFSILNSILLLSDPKNVKNNTDLNQWIFHILVFFIGNILIFNTIKKIEYLKNSMKSSLFDFIKRAFLILILALIATQIPSIAVVIIFMVAMIEIHRIWCAKFAFEKNLDEEVYIYPDWIFLRLGKDKIL